MIKSNRTMPWLIIGRRRPLSSFTMSFLRSVDRRLLFQVECRTRTPDLWCRKQLACQLSHNLRSVRAPGFEPNLVRAQRWTPGNEELFWNSVQMAPRLLSRRNFWALAFLSRQLLLSFGRKVQSAKSDFFPLKKLHQVVHAAFRDQNTAIKNRRRYYER